MPSRPVRGLPRSIAIKRGNGPFVLENLVADTPGDLELRLMANGEQLAQANPMRVATKTSDVGNLMTPACRP